MAGTRQRSPGKDKAEPEKPSEREQLEEAADQAEAPQEELNAVIVRRSFDSSGKPEVGIQVTGDVRITELETIFRLSRKLVESDLDLE